MGLVRGRSEAETAEFGSGDAGDGRKRADETGFELLGSFGKLLCACGRVVLDSLRGVRCQGPAVRHVNGELGQVPPFGFGKLLCAPDTALDWVLPSFRKETPHLRELLGRAGAEGLEILSVAIPTVRQM